MLDRSAPTAAFTDQVGQLRILHRDYETRSPLDLRTVGAHRYAADSRTEIQVIGYAVDDGPVLQWFPGDPIPPVWLEAAHDPGWVVVAHNDPFETAIEHDILGPRHGFPQIPLERHRCTMAAALALALPADQALLARVLRLEHQKDPENARAMALMSRPRRPRKGEDPNGIYFPDDPELFEKLCARNRSDVEIERELFNLLPPLSELDLWLVDQRVNNRGVPFDRALIEAAIAVAKAARPDIDAELAEITNGAVAAATQVARLRAWLSQHGCDTGALDKKTITNLLRGELAPPVRRALELRRAGGQAAARKLDTLLHCLDADDRARGLFRFAGASTGRWSGVRFQPQNMRRPQTDDVDAAVAVVATGDYTTVRARYPNPLAIVGDCLRATICAPDGMVLIGADLSLIEMRVLAWLAGEEKELAVYRRFDATHDPHDDPYLITASWIFHVPVEAVTAEQRQVGKYTTLGFQYQGGIRAFRRIAPDSGFSDQEVERFKLAWRAAHPNIERWWHAIDRAAVTAVRKPNTMVRCGRIAAESNVAFLFLTLPSGRELAYPNPRLVEDRDHGRLVVAFKDNAAGQWRDDRLYGGKLTENVVQAIARDLLAAAMLRVEAAGFPIVFHCHDEIAVEVPESSACAAEFLAIVTATPTWAAGLPVAAKTWSSRRYTK